MKTESITKKMRRKDLYVQDEELETQESPEENETSEPVGDTIKEFGTVNPNSTGEKNPRGTIQFLNIIGQVEGHVILPAHNKSTKYEHVIPQLFIAAEDPSIDGLLILLNTVGGDVEAGLALAELISNLGKPTVSLVIGGGHSIGGPLAVAANYSFIAPSATMTIHPVRVNGTVVGIPQTFDYFNKTQERIVDFIVRNSRITKARLNQLMMDTSKLALDVGTILIGRDAVKEKIIDKVGGLHDAMEKLYSLIGKDV